MRLPCRVPGGAGVTISIRGFNLAIPAQSSFQYCLDSRVDRKYMFAARQLS
jgi:hypothetical protein